MKTEMGDAGESAVGSGASASVPDFAGDGGMTKRARVLSCGFEEGEAVKRVKQGFILPPGFLDPMPGAVFSPTPLSMRPKPPRPSANPAAPLLTSRPLAPPSAVLPVMLPSAAGPVTSSSMVWPVESPSPSTFRLESPPLKLESPPLKLVKVEDTEEGNSCRQFWKAGDYDGPAESSSSFSGNRVLILVNVFT